MRENLFDKVREYFKEVLNCSHELTIMDVRYVSEVPYSFEITIDGNCLGLFYDDTCFEAFKPFLDSTKQMDYGRYPLNTVYQFFPHQILVGPVSDLRNPKGTSLFWVQVSTFKFGFYKDLASESKELKDFLVELTYFPIIGRNSYPCSVFFRNIEALSHCTKDTYDR